VPPWASSADGNALDREPFGYDHLRHVTYVSRDLLSQAPGGARFHALSYRRDASRRDDVLRRPGSPVWQIRMGNYVGSVQSPPSRYPTLGDPSWTTVLAQRAINFPELWLPGQGLPGFDLTFALDQPFAYAGGHLGIEHYVDEGSLTRYDYMIDAVDSLVEGGYVTPLSGTSGCPSGSNRVLGNAPNPGGGDLDLFLFDAWPGAVAVLGLGTSDQWWNGSRLPIDLWPLGLAGCSIYTERAMSFLRPVSSAGLAEFAMAVPGDPVLVSASFFAQWFVVGDYRVNPLFPLTTSEGVRITLGAHLNNATLGMSVVSGYAGSNQFGFVQPRRGPVFRLSYW
jgi:hypothetical protein